MNKIFITSLAEGFFLLILVFQPKLSKRRTNYFKCVAQKKNPSRGLILNQKGKVLTEIERPKHQHDTWTWGMPAWEQEKPQIILGKEHHAWVVLWLSKDGGAIWEKLDFESRNPGVINSKVFVAGNDGIYRSVDQGQSWDKVSEYKVTGKTPVRYGVSYYWTTDGGVIVSTDTGKTWSLLGSPLKGALWGPYFGNAQQSMMVVNQTGFYITKDHGNTWKKAADFFPTPGSELGGEYNVMHPTNSYGWDEKRNIIYAAILGEDVFRLKLEDH